MFAIPTPIIPAPNKEPIMLCVPDIGIPKNDDRSVNPNALN